MIAAAEAREFVPFGVSCIEGHPSLVKCSARQKQNDFDYCADMLRALRGVSLQHSKKDYSWKLRVTEGGQEEELFVTDNVIVWSRRSKDGTRQLVKTLTLEGTAQTALWCAFHLNDYKSRVRMKLEDSESVPELLPTVVAVDSTSGFIHTFGIDGHDYLTDLPFLVSRVWESAFGLILERTARSANASTTSLHLSVLFNLVHPLDEITPILVKSSVPGCLLPKLNHLTPADDVSIVFVSKSPSLVIIYNGQEKTHAIYRLRRTTLEEIQMFIGTNHDGTTIPTIATFGADTNNSMSIRTPDVSINIPAQSTPLSYPLRNRLSGATPLPQSPLIHHQSSSLLQRHHQTSKSTLNSTARLYSIQTPSSVNPSWSNRLDTTMQESTLLAEPLIPDVCLELLWSEPRTQSYGEKAKKAFLTEDVVGQKYVCFMLSTQKCLKMVRYTERSNGNISFHGISTIGVADAEPLSKLRMFVALDSGKNPGVSLYTGTLKVCKVHVPCIPPLKQSAPLRTPKRSSLNSPLTPYNIHAKSLVDDPFLSPTGPPPSETRVDEPNAFGTPFKLMKSEAELRDALGDTVSLEVGHERRCFRFTLPPFAVCPLLKDILLVLQMILSNDLAQSVQAKWYMTRNAPGPMQLCAKAELCAFFDFFLRLLGFEEADQGGVTPKGTPSRSTSPVAQKKYKENDEGTDDDWEAIETEENAASRPSALICNSKYAPIHGETGFQQNIHTIFHAFHILYEDCKLIRNHWYLLPHFASFLYRIAATLQLHQFKKHYYHDFPAFVDCIQIEENIGDGFTVPPIPRRQSATFSAPPLDIAGWIYSAFMFERISPVPILDGITKMSRNIVLVVLAILRQLKSAKDVVTGFNNCPVNLSFLDDFTVLESIDETVVALLVKMEIQPESLSMLPCALQILIQDCLLQCKEFPNTKWDSRAFSLVGRDDLCASERLTKQASDPSSGSNKSPHKYIDKELITLLFPKDERIKDVVRMLRSDKPVPITVQQRPEVSDHDFIEEQERHLYALCIRTMALPVGRGMLSLNASIPMMTDPLVIPNLCLTGRVPPKNITVDLAHIDVPQNMNVWPLFHNGVAVGLMVAPNCTDVDNTWILYNRTKSVSPNAKIEHSGFLLGLGLNGHLSKLQAVTIHDYLLRNDELCRVGLLLGLAASRRGTMDISMTKILSIHVDALLPPTSTELDVASEVRIAAILGVGLVYQGSGHKHMAEVLLGEIGRPPGPEMEYCVDRESYALSAGLALGMVMLGKGSHMIGLSDLQTTDTLHHLMVGGFIRPPKYLKDHRSPSYQIREGDAINVDVTSAGATLALGLMFFNTRNASIAEWMQAPGTQYLLDSIRPDFLMLRTLSKGLVMWSTILPSISWVESHLTPIIKENAFKRLNLQADIDYETMSQAYCNILAGACLAMGLRFAGTSNSHAYETLMFYTKLFLNTIGQSHAEQAGKNTLETCLMVCLLSVSLVMAGTGDLEVLRLCRHLRHRVGQNSQIYYGSHMATHMALGFLFLGGCRLTLRTDARSVAALICALFPKFPTHSNDNRYHLQAFRHLYALACEPRLIVPRDWITKSYVYAHIEVTLKDTIHYKGVRYTMKAPCFLPELNLVQKVEIKDPRYWPIIFESSKNWKSLEALFSSRSSLYVKQKTACLPYSIDPKGYRTMFAQCALKNSLLGRKATDPASFSQSELVIKFTDCFLKHAGEISPCDAKLQRIIGQVLLSCAANEVIENIDILVEFLFLVNSTSVTSMDLLALRQARIVFAYHTFTAKKRLRPSEKYFVPKELLHVVKDEISLKLGSSVTPDDLMSYINASPNICVPRSVLPYVVFHNVPQWCSGSEAKRVTLQALFQSEMAPESIVNLCSILLKKKL